MKRSEVPADLTWDLEDLYKNFASWEKDYEGLPSEEELKKEIENKYKGKLSESPNILYHCLQFKDQLSRKCENLFVYAALRTTEDVADSTANEYRGKIESKMSALFSYFAFLEPEVLQIKDIKKWIETEPLQAYHYQICQWIRSQKHVLSETEEALLAKLQVPLSVYGDVHSKWHDADLKFCPAIDSKGQSYPVTDSKYSLYLTSQDRTLRQNVFHSYYSEISKWRHTIAANYYGNMVAGSAVAKIRHFSSFLESQLFGDQIPPALYHTLIETVRQNLSLLKKSMSIRKTKLNLDFVAPYDRYVSLHSEKKDLRFTWEEGLSLVLEAIAPLGKEYVDIATKGLTVERWIDRAENEGKRSGAFSWGTYDSRPYMLQTWHGTLHDVYTLAHELGHSMHSFYSHKNQPYHTANYTIFVAEVASTLNEALLTRHILTTKKGTLLAEMAKWESLKNFEGTVLRQVLFAAFERSASEITDKNDVFTADLLEEIYLKLNQEWYGSEAASVDLIKHEWMRIPHFYTPFYVYQYATSFCASLALVQAFETDKESTRRKIFSMLKAGGSKPSLEILKDAGVDLLTPKPYEEAFQNYRKNLEL